MLFMMLIFGVGSYLGMLTCNNYMGYFLFFHDLISDLYWLYIYIYNGLLYLSPRNCYLPGRCLAMKLLSKHSRCSAMDVLYYGL
jgi:hypothetical protein